MKAIVKRRLRFFGMGLILLTLALSLGGCGALPENPFQTGSGEKKEDAGQTEQPVQIAKETKAEAESETQIMTEKQTEAQKKSVIEQNKISSENNNSEAEQNLRYQIQIEEKRRDDLRDEYTQKTDLIRQADQAATAYPDLVTEIHELYEQKRKAQNRVSI